VTRPDRVRLAAYTDYVYHRDGDAVYAGRAFALALRGERAGGLAHLPRLRGSPRGLRAVAVRPRQVLQVLHLFPASPIGDGLKPRGSYTL
jgi:hypothetical protein